MGVILDSSVVIGVERQGQPVEGLLTGLRTSG
jgi:hypothetical protein